MPVPGFGVLVDKLGTASLEGLKAAQTQYVRIYFQSHARLIYSIVISPCEDTGSARQLWSIRLFRSTHGRGCADESVPYP
ncbi:hypothetical protein CSW57_04345 [Williamsia muralis]|uniref:Uncharacterized protein n=1 Tax=Williamsia marianensis TaxID=85044 RepID=A0A2G3PRU2_WILMA|nr:hypothetical protein CSW57_04345 [Williamsia marianensis]